MTSRPLFPGLPQPDPRTLHQVAWEVDNIKAVVTDHHQALADLSRPAAAPPSPTRGLLGQLPVPLVWALLALAVLKDPALALKLIGL